MQSSRASPFCAHILPVSPKLMFFTHIFALVTCVSRAEARHYCKNEIVLLVFLDVTQLVTNEFSDESLPARLTTVFGKPLHVVTATGFSTPFGKRRSCLPATFAEKLLACIPLRVLLQTFQPQPCCRNKRLSLLFSATSLIFSSCALHLHTFLPLLLASIFIARSLISFFRNDFSSDTSGLKCTLRCTPMCRSAISRHDTHPALPLYFLQSLSNPASTR